MLVIHVIIFSCSVLQSLLCFAIQSELLTTVYKLPFKKDCRKRRKCWKLAFSLFPTMFSTPPKTNLNFSVIFILSSANAFNLDHHKIWSFAKELIAFFFKVISVCYYGDSNFCLNVQYYFFPKHFCR